jgi:hypothetical protein
MLKMFLFLAKMVGSLMTYSLVSFRMLREAIVGLTILACQNEILFEHAL